jgi:hypothetical protein
MGAAVGTKNFGVGRTAFRLTAPDMFFSYEMTVYTNQKEGKE